MKIIKKIIFTILILIILSAIVYFVYIIFFNADNRFDENTKTKDNIVDENIIILKKEPEKIPDYYANDKDGDGLSDEEEKELGTNIWEPDTDFDGLSDIDEVNKYKTNPNNADTDGDGYRDAIEVLNGYDPLVKPKQ